MRRLLQILIIALSLGFFISCSKDDNGLQGTGTGGGTINVQATYKLIFETKFTTEFHATDYPDNPEFIRPFIVVHNANTGVFSEGNFATSGFELYAEEGDNSGLVSELSSGGDTNPVSILNVTQNVGPSQIREYLVTVTPTMTHISFVSRLSPSPDWFVGVNSFNILNPDNSLVESKGFRLYAMDSGTDSGTTYLSADVEEDEPITTRVGLPFSTNPGQTGKEIGTLTIERVHTN